MPTGTFDYDPSGDDAPQTDSATPWMVCRYDSEEDSGQRYTYLPNIWCQQIQEKEGQPSTAQFSYIMYDTVSDQGDNEDPDEDPNYPSQFEETWPIKSASNSYKVQAGDELVVLYVDPHGAYRVLWHGFAKVPQVDVSPTDQHVTFSGSGVAERLWDRVVKGRLQRDGDQPTTPGGDDNPGANPIRTDLETRFNPDDHPNCTPDDTDETYTDDDGNVFSYPVFLEPGLKTLQGVLDTYAPTASFWTLSKLVRYLLIIGNKLQRHVQNPDFSVLDTLLKNRAPTDGSGFYDPSNPSTYVDHPIVIRDYDATNKPAIECVIEQLEYNGFRLRFITEGYPSEGDSDVVIEEPRDYIEIYRFDAAGPTDPKAVYFPVTRTALNIDSCNVSEFHAANDFHSVANQFTIETRPNRYEVSVILAPGFQPDPADATNQKAFLKSVLDATDAPIGLRQKYRYYIVDELGEGHWNGESMITDSFDFSPIFPKVTNQFEAQDGIPDDADEGDGLFDEDQPEPVQGGDGPPYPWVYRYRPGISKLFSKDKAGKAYHAQLAVSRDFQGISPSIWDGTGTWQNIDGGWHLLEDRLGIEITVEDVNSWAIGKTNPPAGGKAQAPDGNLQGIKSIADPGDVLQQQFFYLRLTCVIESDQCIEAKAVKRLATPYPFTVERRIDAKDHFVKNVIDQSSPYFTMQGGQPGVEFVVKDDTLLAQTHVEQMRSAHEFPPLSATITIPWYSAAYVISDRVDVMDGRDVSFQVNAGSEQSEAPSYPFIVGINWLNGSDKQETVLRLSDRRTEPRKA